MNVSVTWSKIFALLAAFCFLLATFGVVIAGHELIPPGLLFLAVAVLLP